jgi:hypothetical protein
MGYGKIPTNGLVLFYDEGDKLNSFKGAPTTNLVIEPDGNANVLTSDVPFDTDVVGYAQYSSGYFVNPRNTTNVDTAGKTFTYSVYMRSRSATKSTYLMYVFTGNGPDGGWYYFGAGNLTSEWQRYTGSRSDMTGTLSQVTVYRYNQLGTIEIAAPQIEEKSYATQFIKGSRTNTQSLIDISGNSVLQLVNNTFDASGNLNFDGTNTYIQVDRDVLSSNSPYTLVTIMRPTNLSSLNDSFPQYNTHPSGFWHHMNSGGGIAWRHSGTSGNFGNHGMSNNQWGMHTISYDGTTLKLYANGELQNTTTSAGGYGNNGTGLARIGMLAQRNSGYDYNYNGVIPVNMVYNRALSQSEIFDIYEHFRPRYTLPNIKDGGTEAKAAPNAQHLYELGIRANGVYWINNGTSTKQTYCEFKNGEGWMLVMNIKSDYYGDSYLSWNDYNNWINAGDELGNPPLPYTTTGQYRNRDIFRYYPCTKWMIKIHNNGTEFGNESWAAWQLLSGFSGQTFETIMNTPGATGGGTQITSTYYAQRGLGKTTYNRGLDWCSITRTLGHLRVNHLLNNNGVRILGSEQTLETSNTDVTRGIGQIYDIAGTALDNQAYAQYNTHIGPYVDGTGNFQANRRQFTDQLFPDNSNYNAARGEGLNVNPSLTYGGTPAMVDYFHYAIFIK